MIKISTIPYSTKKVLIFGAFVAVLATAWWLNLQNFDVEVVEKYPDFKQNGYMIGLSGPGLNIAEKMGLKNDLLQQNISIGENLYISKTGKHLHKLNYSKILEELEFLNPSYKLNVIPYVKDRHYVLCLPLDKMGVFLANEKEVYAYLKAEEEKNKIVYPEYTEMDERIVHKVKSGDYLGKIANRYGVRVSQIKRWNRLKTSSLKIGQHLYIYPKKVPFSVSKISTKKKKELSTTPVKKGKYEIYIVQKGDSLWSISKKFPKVSIDQIKKWNNIWSVKNLKPGMKLKIFKS